MAPLNSKPLDLGTDSDEEDDADDDDELLEEGMVMDWIGLEVFVAPVVWCWSGMGFGAYSLVAVKYGQSSWHVCSLMAAVGQSRLKYSLIAVVRCLLNMLLVWSSVVGGEILL
jgi:hypothetical protein